MYKSKYLPVKVYSNTEAAVHTAETVYPINLLCDAHEYLTGKQNTNVIVRNNNVSFVSNQDVRWFMCDIVNAYELFQIAKDNKFAFFPIYDKKGILSLYTSSTFNSARLLVDAFTMNTVLVTKTSLVKKLSQMIDQKFSVTYLLDLFRYATMFESGHKNFIDAWLCQLDANDSYMALNPLTALYLENSIYYGYDELEELERIVLHEETQAGNYVLDGNFVKRTDLSYWTPMTVDWCRTLVMQWKKLLVKNSLFIQLPYADTLETICYVSSDLSHAIHANTGEMVSIKNKNLKDMIRMCLAEGSITSSDFQMLWSSLTVR